MFYVYRCREADESRLREVCEGFLGPPTGMAESTDPKNPAWDPIILVRPFLRITFSVLHYVSDIIFPLHY